MDIGIGRGIVWLTWSGLDGLLMALTLPSHSIEGMRAYASDASPGAYAALGGTEVPKYFWMIAAGCASLQRECVLNTLALHCHQPPPMSAHPGPWRAGENTAEGSEADIDDEQPHHDSPRPRNATWRQAKFAEEQGTAPHRKRKRKTASL
ncbi:hypothetical protein HYFRA_00012365 [Hymenoscyphus fraxineus]|uniref:Uncharacterized protein n=1 Tax=Hymenoscyphus fraxineus TaxID=746836 RepID=A0A9N9L384_9HELO|nr:hypothetical protein HYFRA_00012365 [Hymenoscyphus fraxineus]